MIRIPPPIPAKKPSPRPKRRNNSAWLDHRPLRRYRHQLQGAAWSPARGGTRPFSNYVAKDKIPPESCHSFNVSAGWIKMLDRRVKEHIRIQTRSKMKEKETQDRENLTAKIDKQIAARKITKLQYEAKLGEHAETWYRRTENPGAQKIQRVQAYSFNLPNYRRSPTADQIKAITAYREECLLIESLEKRAKEAREAITQTLNQIRES